MSTQKQPVRRRLACDRCHSFKLKCPRSSLNGGDPCARCVKAGATCSYSPSMRGQIRAKQVPPYISGTAPLDGFNKNTDGGIALPTFEAPDDIFNTMVIDWTVPENGFLHDDFEPIPQLQSPGKIDTSNTTNSPSQNHADSGHGSINMSNQGDGVVRILQHEPTQRPQPSPDYLGFPMPDTLQSADTFLQLTNILFVLENLARGLPSFRVHAEQTKPSTSNPDNDTIVDDEQDFGVGKTFAITNKLADIYIPLIEQTEQRQKTSHDILDLSGKPMDSVDHPLLYLLFSCHNRLIDLWHSMLAHALAVHTSDRYAPGPDGRVQAHCAHFKMGTYEPSLSSTVVPVEVIILQELKNHLANRLMHLIEIIDPGSNDAAEKEEDTRFRSTRATVLSAKALHQRASDMCKDISQLKGTLEASTAKPGSGPSKGR